MYKNPNQQKTLKQELKIKERQHQAKQNIQQYMKQQKLFRGSSHDGSSTYSPAFSTFLPSQASSLQHAQTTNFYQQETALQPSQCVPSLIVSGSKDENNRELLSVTFGGFNFM